LFGVARRCVSSATVVIAVSLMFVGLAQGAVTHEFLGRLEGFGSPVALAVGPVGQEASVVEKHAVFVPGRGRVDRLTRSGVVLPFECKTVECGKYIERDRLTGTPPGSVAVSRSCPG
jgi:hypothetical protein